MAIRDAGDYGFGMSFEDAVKKGRSENWSDRDIAALLKTTEEEVSKVVREKVAIRLEDLKFRPDSTDGGTVIEYVVDGRKKTQTIPRMVADVLEAVIQSHLDWVNDYKGIVKQYGDLIIDLRERVDKIERLASTSGRNGNGERANPGSGEPAKEETTTGPKKRASKTA